MSVIVWEGEGEVPPDPKGALVVNKDRMVALGTLA